MAPPVPSSFKSQGNNNHPPVGDRQSDDEEPMPEEDMEDMEEFEAEEALMMDEEEEAAAASGGGGHSHRSKLGDGSSGRQSAPPPITAGGDFKCSVCDFSTRSRVTLQRHERLTHLKKKVRDVCSIKLCIHFFFYSFNSASVVLQVREMQLRHARESALHETRQISLNAHD